MQNLKKLLFKKNWKSEEAVLFDLIRREVFMFLILILSLLFFTQFFISYQYKQEERQLEHTLKNKVATIQTAVDEYIERCQIIDYVLMQDESVFYLMNNTYSDALAYKLKLYLTASRLNSLCLTNSFVKDIVLCINEYEINVNRYGSLTMDKVYTQYIHQSENGYTYQQWLSESLNFNNGNLLFLSDGTCYFIKSYPVTPRGLTNKSITLIQFKENVLKNYLPNDSERISFTILNNSEGSDLLHGFESSNINPKSLSLTEQSGTFLQDGYYFSYQKSEELNMTYIAFADQDTLIHQKNNWHFCTVFILLAAFLIGSAVIIVYSLKKLNPLNQLRSTVLTDGNNAPLFGDPYAETKSMLLETADQQITNLSETRQTHARQLEHTFIALLYDKKVNLELLSETADQLKISYQEKQNCFIKLKCIDISNCFQKIADHKNNDCTPVQFCAMLIAEMLSTDYDILAIPHGQEAFFVLSLDENTLKLQLKEVKHQLQQIQRLLQESYGIDTLMALSNFHSGLNGLHSAFKETVQIMEYLEFSASSNFAEYGFVSVINKHRSTNDIFLKEETKMLNAIKTGEYEQAKQIFDYIINNLFPNMQENSQLSKFHIYALAGKVLEAFDTGSRIHLDMNEQFLNFDTIVEFKEKVYNLFEQMKDASQSQENSDKHSLVSNIMDIIASNYMNPDLNVSMIASLLNKNLDYVSRTFKKNTGLGILECIQDYRIAKAKTFLEENPNLTIQQVSAMIGYVNCESFIRIFKQKQGVTPGRYKATLSLIHI